MHKAAQLISSQLLAPGGPSQWQALTPANAAALLRALHTDSISYIYSGAVSTGDATQAAHKSLYSWATVKLYYSTFYFLRAMLALDGSAIFYVGTTPYKWKATAGSIPIKLSGNTHKAALSTFKTAFPGNAITTQEVAGKPALEWLMQKRESVNYGIPRFSEPDPPAHFGKIASIGVRRAISAYVSDVQYLYAFDPDHAILAMPIDALKQCLVMSKNVNIKAINEEDTSYLITLFSDSKGPLSDMAVLLRSL
ncbi:hypothetical protein QT917_009945 [Xanthomonas campestris pv. campestris]|uniref:hypothetical protein n=1 Tax=Xanthomonas campestris TaxID=339 RepID=UPI0025A20A97|nr:hypothetical protein [Xanthomonas campestris]MDM7704114.1 hypothetical protein [Xanthomonas campestris pv. campestris]